MKNQSIYWIVCLSIGLVATSLAQNSSQKSACQEPEYRQLDFWVGNWELWYDKGEGQPRGKAVNRVVKNDFGDCVVTEHFSMPGFKGSSYSMYHKAIGKWRQTWVDDAGGYYDLIGGPAPENANYDFELELVHPQGVKSPFLRMIWKIEDKDHLVWRWQGHKQGESNWKDIWVLHYQRTSSD